MSVVDLKKLASRLKAGLERIPGSGYTQTSLAKKYGVSAMSIGNVYRNAKWSHLK